jgi:adenosylmethionine---8-amino-7-oxononanoate aminotransferase
MMPTGSYSTIPECIHFWGVRSSRMIRMGFPTTCTVRRRCVASSMTLPQVQDLDQRHVWHPYAAMPNPLPCFVVQSASGCQLNLLDGRTLIDGMSSWWACIHGYNHPVLNQAAKDQMEQMSHVMFGGLTHIPAVSLAQALTEIIPSPSPLANPTQMHQRLDKIFYCDSGSVAIEVAMKMALQYHYNLDNNNNDNNNNRKRCQFLTVRGGYHGDTFEAMSVCDPIHGMHHMFASVLSDQIFCSRPEILYHEAWDKADLDNLERTVQEQYHQIAAIIIEPIVQGAGGMRFYSPQYLIQLRKICDDYGILLIFDEIATGFGRTGKMFAMEHTATTTTTGNDNNKKSSGSGSAILPDILCLGKALSGGFMSFAATLTSEKIATVFARGPAGVLMHGPTFMGNPLACAVSLASLKLLQSYNLPTMIGSIEAQLRHELSPCKESPYVEDVRVLGAIGVIEMKQPVNMAIVQPQLVDHGVWLRPFGKLLYTMPPFIIQDHELRKITQAMVAIAMQRPH